MTLEFNMIVKRFKHDMLGVLGFFQHPFKI